MAAVPRRGREGQLPGRTAGRVGDGGLHCRLAQGPDHLIPVGPVHIGGGGRGGCRRRSGCHGRAAGRIIRRLGAQLHHPVLRLTAALDDAAVFIKRIAAQPQAQSVGVLAGQGRARIGNDLEGELHRAVPLGNQCVAGAGVLRLAVRADKVIGDGGHHADGRAGFRGLLFVGDRALGGLVRAVVQVVAPGVGEVVLVHGHEHHVRARSRGDHARAVQGDGVVGEGRAVLQGACDRFLHGDHIPQGTDDVPHLMALPAGDGVAALQLLTLFLPVKAAEEVRCPADHSRSQGRCRQQHQRRHQHGGAQGCLFHSWFLLCPAQGILHPVGEAFRHVAEGVLEINILKLLHSPAPPSGSVVSRSMSWK